MSTVLLMTDTWHPTVLRLVPFSSNNAKVNERKSNGRQSNHRGFPILAVTRNGNKNSASSNERRSARSSSTRSVQSARSDYYIDKDNGSEISAYTLPARAFTDRSEDYVTKYRKYPQKKIPVMHSEMKEAIRFSVQDLNDQVSSSSSLHSTEDCDKEKVQKVDNTRTLLPKPSTASPLESKFITPPNGVVRRSVPLTPGEMELQKFRDTCMIDQLKGRKKYKLNVNQIPRSTTPINDHDPDKLNMKQVIAFLQTKTPKDTNVKNSASERKNDTHRSQTYSCRSSVASTVSVRQKPAELENTSLGRSSVETKVTDHTETTRQTNGCVSVMSTKSTPNLPYGQSKKKEKTPGSMSVRSYGNRSKDSKDSPRKPVKEFKLYRFLAIAPEGEKRHGLTTAVTESIPQVDVTSLEYSTQKNQSSPESRRKFLRKRGRESTTANLIHRRAVNRTGPLPVMPLSSNQPEVAIRLPSMGDSPDEDSDTCSTTSATYNSTKTGSNENIKLPKKERSISFLDEKQVNYCDTNEDENSSIITGKVISCFQPKAFKTPEFPKVSIQAPPRHIHVNMPQENKKGYSQEIVRLTLRQEKSTTRVNSYMSDIQSNSPNKWHELEKSELLENSKIDSREWDLNTARHLVNSLGNNNFIKVRQKLKTSNMST